MALYFKDVEITNIDNLVPQTGLDITDLWFGETNIYTVWETYEGTLPATFNANGADIRQYQVYGNAGGVGDRTVNLLSYREIDYEHSWDNSGQKAPPTGTGNFASPMIAVVPGRTYLRTYNLSPTDNVFFTYDAQKNFLNRESAGNNLPFTVGQNVAYITYNIPVKDGRLPELYMLTPGTTPPETYVPYGYKLDISVSDGTNATTTPIYIGTDPLYENEYVDYQAGKVYKYGANIFSSVGATDGKYFLQNGRMASSIPWSVTDYIDVPSGSIYKYSGDAYASDAKSVYHTFYTANKKQISTICIYGLSTFTTPVNCAYIRLSYRTGNVSSVNLQALTSADPPAPLPVLPTCKGTTIIDYTGSGTAPEKVLLKYRKEGY